MTLLLILDTETSGLEETDALLEWAAALYHVGERSILWSHSAIVPSVDTNPIPEINGISNLLLAAARTHWSCRESLLPLVTIAGESGVELTAILAHNAEFDRRFLESAMFPLHRAGVPIPWLDTQSDIVYPHARGSQHLSHLCADHGLVAVQQHRALSDVMMLCALLSLVDDLEEQVATALLPSALFEALVSFDDRELAKNAGFGWSMPPGERKKMWWRKLPEETSTERCEGRPFEMRRI